MTARWTWVKRRKMEQTLSEPFGDSEQWEIDMNDDAEFVIEKQFGDLAAKWTNEDGGALYVYGPMDDLWGVFTVERLHELAEFAADCQSGNS